MNTVLKLYIIILLVILFPLYVFYHFFPVYLYINKEFSYDCNKIYLTCVNLIDFSCSMLKIIDFFDRDQSMSGISINITFFLYLNLKGI